MSTRCRPASGWWPSTSSGCGSRSPRPAGPRGARRRRMTRRPTIEHLARPRTAGPGVDVFAVEDTTAQVVWSDLPAGDVRIEFGAGAARRRPSRRSGGRVQVDGLTPDTRRSVPRQLGRRQDDTATDPDRCRRRPDASSSGSPPINDLHLGRGERGLHGHLPHGDVDAASHPFTAARDAIAGRRRTGVPSSWWSRATSATRPTTGSGSRRPTCWSTCRSRSASSPATTTRAASVGSNPRRAPPRHGLRLTRGVDHLDVPGLRIVLVDSTIDGNGWGAVGRHADQAATLAGEASTGVFVATHHQAQRFRVPTVLAPRHPGAGCHGPSREPWWPPTHARWRRRVTPTAAGRATSRACRGPRSRPPTTSRACGPATASTRAGSCRWCGGRREPETLAWSEHTRDMLGGVWALWATGTISDRCFTLDWTT